MFVKLRDGHEPFVVNPDNICALEGTHGGRQTTVIMTNGGTQQLAITVDECLRRINDARKHADDWLDDPLVERTAAGVVKPGAVINKGSKR